MKARLANALWLASCGPGWRRFQSTAGHVEDVQASLLMRCLEKNKNTDYGRRYQFDSIASPAQYQQRVPLTAYDDYAEDLVRLAAGEPAVLTAQPVRMFELSSGSIAPSKLIPYTDDLKSEFQRGLAPWIFDLYSHHPDLQCGSAYWSVTPLTDGRRFTAGGIPVGFESDSAYLGPLGKWLVDSVLAVPDVVKLISRIADFRYVTLLCLLRQPGLRLISIWNPTFLSLLLAALPRSWESLLGDIRHGTLTLPESSQDVGLRFAPDLRRARALEALNPTDYESLWPRLSWISCWMDGASARYAGQMGQLFPHAHLQGKGLMATEAFVSFPLVGVDGCVLSINSHFFEFIGDSGETLLAHQIEKGHAYSVVVTTGGGFYRYQLHDVVEVVGTWKQIPCIRFVGKADHVSDWFGEKLEERFVAGVLERVFAKHHLSPAFAMLAPEAAGAFRYVLFLESQGTDDSLEKDLDEFLCENFHYAYARKLGQLAPVEVVKVMHGMDAYLRGCQARGQKLGNIKPSLLHKDAGWSPWFGLPQREST